MRKIAIGVLAGMFMLAACGSSGGSKTSTGAPKLSGSFCDKAKQAENDVNNNSDVTNQATAQKDLDQLKQIASSAPSEIKSDLNTLVDFFQKYTDAVKKANGNEQALAASMAGLQGDEAGLKTASQNIENYLVQHCGFTPTTS